MQEAYEPIPTGIYRPELVQLIDRMLMVDHRLRPSACDICQLHWLRDECYSTLDSFISHINTTAAPNSTTSSSAAGPTSTIRDSTIADGKGTFDNLLSPNRMASDNV